MGSYWVGVVEDDGGTEMLVAGDDTTTQSEMKIETQLPSIRDYA